nr:MAK10-like protein [Tanacetum cinerariifolium]
MTKPYSSHHFIANCFIVRNIKGEWSKLFLLTSMGDENLIRTLGYYSRPSHEGYRNTIKLLEGNNMVHLRSDTIWLVQNGCSFYGHWSEDQNQHLKDFLKLVDSLDFDRDPSPHGRILLLVSLLNYICWEGLQNSVTTSLCCNNIKDNLFLKHGLILRTYSKKSLTMTSIFGSKSKSFMTMSIPLQDEPSINRDFAKPVKAISLPQDVPSTSDHHFIELKNQVQCLMEAHLAPKQRIQVNKITSSCEICSGPYDTQYCMENLEQAFFDYASSQTDEARVLAHASIYNTMLDKYVESLEIGKNGSAFMRGEVFAKIEDLGLFTLPCRLGDSKPFDTLAGLGSCVSIIPLYLFKKLNIKLLEETNHIFGLVDRTKSYLVGIVKNVDVHIGKLKLLNEFYIIDMKKNPETPLLIRRGFLATVNAVIDCRKAKIAVGKGITISLFGVKGVDLGENEAHYWTTLGKRKSYKPRPSSDGVGVRTPYYARKDILECYLPRE